MEFEVGRWPFADQQIERPAANGQRCTNLFFYNK